MSNSILELMQEISNTYLERTGKDVKYLLLGYNTFFQFLSELRSQLAYKNSKIDNTTFNGMIIICNSVNPYGIVPAGIDPMYDAISGAGRAYEATLEQVSEYKLK